MLLHQGHNWLSIGLVPGQIHAHVPGLISINSRFRMKMVEIGLTRLVIDVENILLNSPNSFSYRGSYFKLGGEGSQNFVASLRGGWGGAVTHAGGPWGRLSHRVSLEVSSSDARTAAGSQIQDQAATQGVVGGVIFWCAYGCGFADPILGCRHTGCCVYRGQGFAERSVTEGVIGGVIWCLCTGGGSGGDSYLISVFCFFPCPEIYKRMYLVN